MWAMHITWPKSLCVPMSGDAMIIPHFQSSAVLLQPATSCLVRLSACVGVTHCHPSVTLRVWPTKVSQGSWHCLTPDNRAFVGLSPRMYPHTTSTCMRQPHRHQLSYHTCWNMLLLKATFRRNHCSQRLCWTLIGMCVRFSDITGHSHKPSTSSMPWPCAGEFALWLISLFLSFRLRMWRLVWIS